MTPLLQFAGIEKSFFGVRVLKGVSFDVGAGRVVGLVGENGAGKSTLMNILGGNRPADAGALRLDGEDFAPLTSADAARAGVAFIHQELNLFPNLSIAENLFLTAFPRLGGLPVIDRAASQVGASALLREVGLELPPETPVGNLSAGERQLVEIAKALGLDARLIILDEPTTSLSARETETLFALLGCLRARGIAMIYISHALGDVLRLCDDIVVLRDGEVVGAGTRSDFTAERMISLMVGRSLNQLYPTRAQSRAGVPLAPADPATAGEVEPGDARAGALAGQAGRLPYFGGKAAPLLEVRGVTQAGIVRDVSFELAAGEVLGLSGLMGAGRSELARILFGLDPLARGEILLEGRPVSRLPARRRIERGLAFLTEDRHGDGLCLEAAIADNIALVSLRQHCRPPLKLLDAARWREAIRRIREAVRLTPAARDEQPVRTLSGGNQQKVVLAKWLLARPRVLILDEPTRGIDVGAKFEIYQLIHELADGGAGVLVISSEIEELIGLCDRILVMSRGRIGGEFRRGEFDRERILHASLPDNPAGTLERASS